jgi:hypothetical protein
MARVEAGAEGDVGGDVEDREVSGVECDRGRRGRCVSVEVSRCADLWLSSGMVRCTIMATPGRVAQERHSHAASAG